jgi:tripartite-type tricarboxylate transporter receptor subunit TctC
MRRHPACLVLLAASIFCSGALAQGFPSKPVRLVVPFAAGGAVDTVARGVGLKLSEVWGQPIVVENRAGAGGNIGADAVAKSAPDGYSLLINISGQAISPALYRKLPFDSVKDFTPLVQLTYSFLILVANTKMPGTVAELIALAKANPGKLNYGSTGLGAPPHLVGELLRLTAGIDVVHVPYKGDAPLMPALLSGEVQFAFLPMLAAIPQLKADRLRGLAVTGSARSAMAPQVPTIAEAGLRDFEYAGWMGLFGPGAMPSALVARINADANRVIRMPDMLERWPAWGYEPAGGTPEAFAARYRSDIDKFARIVREARVPLVD